MALKHVQDQPRPLAELRPDLPADLCGMVHKMMAKDPDERYQSAREILRDLMKVRDGVMVGLTQTNGAAVTLRAGAALSFRHDHQRHSAHGTVNDACVQRAALGVLEHRRGLGGVAALAAGALLFAGSKPRATATPAPSTPLPAVGLPDVRLQDKFVTSRERELLALLDKRGLARMK